MRAGRVGFAIAVLVLALIAVVAWFSWPAGEDDGAATAEQPVGSRPGAAVPVTAVPEASQPDGGRWTLSGRVFEQRDEADAVPARGAQVELFEVSAMPGAGQTCADCGADLLFCEAPASTRALLALARAHAPRPAPIATTTTDAEGRFSFDELPAGQLKIIATTPLGVRSEEATPGLEVSLVISATPALSLVVRTEDGSALPPLSVTLISIDTGEVREAPVGRDGRVTLPAISGDTWAGVDVPGWLPASAILEDGTELLLQRPRTLVVHTRLGGKPVDAEVELEEHATVTRSARGGEVRFTGLADLGVSVRAFTSELSSGSVNVELSETETEVTLELRRSLALDVFITGVDGAPVAAAWASLSSGLGRAYEPKTLEDGFARFEGVPEGEYTLAVRAGRFVEFTRQVDLAPGPNELHVTLRPAPLVRGVVVDAAGKPVVRAEVRLQTGAAASSEITMTGDDGTFEFELAEPGRVTVEAWSGASGRGSASGQAGEALTVRLSMGAVLEVEIIDVDGRRVAEQVLVQSASVPQGRYGRSADPFGRIAGLEPGSWILSVEPIGRLSVEQPFELSADEVRRVTVRLSEGHVIEGRVLEADGSPVRDAQVTGVPNSMAMADAQGRFRITGAPQGPVHLLAFAGDSNRSVSATVEAPARDVVLRFDPRRRVTGRVVGDGGKPVTRFVIDGNWVSDAKGRFELELQDGLHSVYADGYLTKELEVAREGDLGVVQLERMKVLRGDVMADGKPVAGAVVRLVEAYEESVTDAAGRFELQAIDLPDGPVHVAATRGALSGQAEALLGGPPAHVTLARGTHVRGRVVDEAGKPWPTLVELTLGRDEALRTEVSTDADGRFEVDLLPGQWAIAPRAAARRMFTISGASQDVTVVSGGRCVLALDDDSARGVVWLVPPVVLGPVDWNTGQGLPPGSVAVSEIDTPEGSSVPCGAWELVGVSDGRVHRKAVTLEPGVVARVHLAGHDAQAPQ